MDYLRWLFWSLILSGKSKELSGLAAGRGHRPDPALQAGHALLEGCSGRVGDAGVDVSVLLEGEQVSGVGGVLKHETGRLVDGHRPSAGGRIRAASCVEGTGSKTPVAIGHGMECRTAPSGRSPPARRAGRTGGDWPPGWTNPKGGIISRSSDYRPRVAR